MDLGADKGRSGPAVADREVEPANASLNWSSGNNSKSSLARPVGCGVARGIARGVLCVMGRASRDGAGAIAGIRNR
jgi:hypothetical protein